MRVSIKRYCLALVIVLVYVSAACADAPSSSMNFNASLLYDESGVEWTPSGDPVLSSMQSISGGKSLYIDGNSYIRTKNTQPLTCPESSHLRRGYAPKNG